MCSRNGIIITITIIIIIIIIITIIINIIVYIIVEVVCQNRPANGLNRCKHEISDFALFYIFYPVLLHSVTYRSRCK